MATIHRTFICSLLIHAAAVFFIMQHAPPSAPDGGSFEVELSSLSLPRAPKAAPVTPPPPAPAPSEMSAAPASTAPSPRPAASAHSSGGRRSAYKPGPPAVDDGIPRLAATVQPAPGGGHAPHRKRDKKKENEPVPAPPGGAAASGPVGKAESGTGASPGAGDAEQQ